MKGINISSNRWPSMATLTQISMGVNVVTLVILLPATIVLLRQLEIHRNLLCPDNALEGDDVTRPSDVTKSDDERSKVNDLNRYCYREDQLACADKGGHVKSGKDGHSLCCGHLGSHLYDVMSETLRDNLHQEAYKGQLLQKVKQCITELHSDTHAATFRPAAHVGILSTWNLTGEDDHVPRIHWDDSAEGSFLTGGVIHGVDRLTVTKPGYYYIYSGLQYNMDPARDDYGAVVAYLFRTVNGTEESLRKLMMSRVSSCLQTPGPNVPCPVSLHMAGIFLLRAADEISVRATSPNLLHSSPASTYFGMHMV